MFTSGLILVQEHAETLLLAAKRVESLAVCCTAATQSEKLAL